MTNMLPDFKNKVVESDWGIIFVLDFKRYKSKRAGLKLEGVLVEIKHTSVIMPGGVEKAVYPKTKKGIILNIWRIRLVKDYFDEGKLGIRFIKSYIRFRIIEDKKLINNLKKILIPALFKMDNYKYGKV